MSEFKVSVIIPVYNAEKYLRTAVESAVAIEEVGEVLLIEDKSPDNAFELCLQLEKEYEKVTVYTHPNRANRGPAASRNLGISKASFDYIAFLDADDWYLPNRFVKSKEIFSKYKEVEGVYEATGFYNEITQSLDTERLTMLKDIVSPEDLLFTLLKLDRGRFTTDAITFVKSILRKSGVFDESLRLHEDTHLWLRMAQVGKLVPGKLKEPVAIRRTHAQNTSQHLNKETRSLFHTRTFQWFENQDKVDPRAYRIIFNRFAASRKSSILTRLIFIIMYLVKHPQSINKFV